MKNCLGKSALYLHSFLVYLFLFFPIAVLIIFSFNRERINVIWTGFTLDWYKVLFNDTDLLNSVKNSLIVGTFATIISTILGTLAAFGMVRYKFPGKKLFDAVLQLPIIIPDIVMAIAMLSFFVLIKFSLGLTSIIIAHISFDISFVAVVVRARLMGFNLDLENAALDLGATPFKTFRYITLPLIMPGIIAGALIAFTLSWDDFMIAFFTAGVGSTTLPLKVYSMVKLGVSPEINAIATITIVFTMLLIITAMSINKKANDL